MAIKNKIETGRTPDLTFLEGAVSEGEATPTLAEPITPIEEEVKFAEPDQVIEQIVEEAFADSEVEYENTKAEYEPFDVAMVGPITNIIKKASELDAKWKARSDAQIEQMDKLRKGEDPFEITDKGTWNLSTYTEDELKAYDELLSNLKVDLGDEGKSSLLNVFDNIKTNPDGSFNIMSFDEEMNKIITPEFLEKARGKTTIEEIAADAAHLGLNDILLKIKHMKKGEVLDVTSFLATGVRIGFLQQRINDILTGSSLKKPLSGNKIKEFQKLMSLKGALLNGFQQSKSGYGRGARVGQILTTDNPNLKLDMSMDAKELQEMGVYDPDITPEDFQRIRLHLINLEPHQKTRFAKEVYGRKLSDAWVEVWVNSRLAAPTTHMINTVANGGYNALRFLEYGLASGINKATGNSPYGVQWEQMNAMIKSLGGAFLDGASSAYTSFSRDIPVTKMDLPPRKVIGAEMLPDKYKNSFMAPILKYYGTVTRLPGRLLIAEDEFFKGAIFRIEKDRMAVKRKNEYLALNPDDKEGALRTYNKTLIDPDTNTLKEIRESMLVGTFQQDLPEGFFTWIQKGTNHPVGRMFVPFYKTLTNIFFATSERTPGINLLMPSIRRDLGIMTEGKIFKKNVNPEKRQLALAKISTGLMGSLIFENLAFGASDGTGDYIITGAAPKDRAEKNVFMNRGYQPYSIGVRQDDGSFKFTSYAGFEPISGLLAMSADLAYLETRPDFYDADQGKVNKFVEARMHMINAYFDYAAEQPFASALSALGKAFNSPPGEGQEIIDKLAAGGTQGLLGGAVEFGLSPLTGTTLANYLNKMQDQTYYSNAMTTAQGELYYEISGKEYDDVPYSVRSFYSALNNIYQRSRATGPLSYMFQKGVDLTGDVFDKENKYPSLNLWGEVMVGPEQSVYSPFKVLNKKRSAQYSAIDDFLAENYLGAEMPKSKVGDVTLYREEYYDLITFMNEDEDGDGVSDFLKEANSLFTLDSFNNATIAGKLDRFTGLRNKYRAKAIEKLKVKYKRIGELQSRIDEKKESPFGMETIQ